MPPTFFDEDCEFLTQVANCLVVAREEARQAVLHLGQPVFELEPSLRVIHEVTILPRRSGGGLAHACIWVTASRDSGGAWRPVGEVDH